jgi:antitoxin VapB
MDAAAPRVKLGRLGNWVGCHDLSMAIRAGPGTGTSLRLRYSACGARCPALPRLLIAAAGRQMLRPVTQRRMIAERYVKLFRNGRNQAVRIPRELELPGTEAIMRQEGHRLVIEPLPKKSLLALLDSREPIAEDFPEIDDPPPEPVDFP